MKKIIIQILVLILIVPLAEAQDENVLDLSAPKVGQVGLIKEKLTVLGSIDKGDSDGVAGAIYPTKNRKQYVCLFVTGVRNDKLKFGDEVTLPGRYEVTLFKKERNPKSGQLIFFVGVKAK
jgi:hypothetical protein